MRLEKRFTLDKNRRRVLRGICLISESEEESKAIDEIFGDKVDKDGLIGERICQARLSDGYAEHYLYVEKKHEDKKKFCVKQ